MTINIDIIEPDIPFLSNQGKPTCKKAWRKLFSVLKKAELQPDVILCVLMANSANVLLSPRSSRKDEDNPEWESPPEVGFSVEGLCEELNLHRGAKGRPAREQICEKFYDWMKTALMDSFQSAPIQKLYQEHNPKGRPFSIFWSTHDAGLRHTSLKLLWSSDGGLNEQEVVDKQVKLQQGARYKAVRKKTPAEIKAQSESSRKNSKQKKRLRRRNSSWSSNPPTDDAFP